MPDQNNPLTMDDLKKKVDNYRQFATKEIPPENVFVSAVFHRDALAQIFANAPDADGVRIYSMKHSDSASSDDISYLMVPVMKTDKGFEDQIDDNHFLMKTSAMVSDAVPCMGPFCK